MTKKEIKAIINTFYYKHGDDIRGICPKCGEYMILDGYVCFGCGYDDSSESE